MTVATDYWRRHTLRVGDIGQSMNEVINVRQLRLMSLVLRYRPTVMLYYGSGIKSLELEEYKQACITHAL